MANEYRVSQFAVETLTDSPGAARLSSFTVEVAYSGSPEARISHFALEVLREITIDAGSGRRRQIVN